MLSQEEVKKYVSSLTAEQRDKVLTNLLANLIYEYDLESIEYTHDYTDDSQLDNLPEKKEEEVE